VPECRKIEVHTVDKSVIGIPWSGWEFQQLSDIYERHGEEVEGGRRLEGRDKLKIYCRIVNAYSGFPYCYMEFMRMLENRMRIEVHDE
jgi:hypothetical protein